MFPQHTKPRSQIPIVCTLTTVLTELPPIIVSFPHILVPSLLLLVAAGAADYNAAIAGAHQL